MTYSINLNNFKKVAAVATFLTTAACLVPEAAGATSLGQPLTLRFSGDSSNNSRISFNINTSVPDSNSDSSLGYFPNSIQDFKFIYSGSIPDDSDGRTSAEFKFGNLTASREGSFVKYEVTFDPSPNNVNIYEFNEFSEVFNQTPFPLEDFRLLLRIPSNNEDFINSLTTEVPKFTEVIVGDKNDLNRYLELTFQGGSECLDEVQKIRSCGVETKTIPEPSEVAGLLGAGAIGAVSLLKRNRRSRKLASSRLTLSN